MHVNIVLFSSKISGQIVVFCYKKTEWIFDGDFLISGGTSPPPSPRTCLDIDANWSTSWAIVTSGFLAAILDYTHLQLIHAFLAV